MFIQWPVICIFMSPHKLCVSEFIWNVITQQQLNIGNSRD